MWGVVCRRDDDAPGNTGNSSLGSFIWGIVKLPLFLPPRFELEKITKNLTTSKNFEHKFTLTFCDLVSECFPFDFHEMSSPWQQQSTLFYNSSSLTLSATEVLL